jgi:hypothetical protein
VYFVRLFQPFGFVPNVNIELAVKTFNDAILGDLSLYSRCLAMAVVRIIIAIRLL